MKWPQQPSLDADTFAVLGEEIGWNIKIVSAEEEDRALLQQFDIDLDAEIDEDKARSSSTSGYCYGSR